MSGLPGIIGRRLRGANDSRQGLQQTGPSSAVEPCAACGQETAAGSGLFALRHDILRPEGGKYFLCDDCYARWRSLKTGHPTPTAQDLLAVAADRR